MFCVLAQVARVKTLPEVEITKKKIHRLAYNKLQKNPQ
jgi:hypothetical protein